MKALVIIFFIVLKSGAQGIDLTAEFDRFFQGDGTVELGFSVGNGCENDERYFVCHYNGNMDMNGQELEIMHSHIIVYGDILNEGTIVYKCDSSILEVLGGTLDTDEPDLNKLQVFPNPATSEINITGAPIDKLQLFDIYGRELKVYQTWGERHRIMIDDLASGVYILVVDNYETFKIVKL